jgi:hypothetical protein
MGRTGLRSLLDPDENLWQTKVNRCWQIIINNKDTRPCVLCCVPETQGSENMSVHCLANLAAYVRLGIVPQPH